MSSISRPLNNEMRDATGKHETLIPGPSEHEELARPDEIIYAGDTGMITDQDTDRK